VRRHLATIALATLALGIAVTASWFAVGRGAAYVGLDPESMTRPSRLVIYGVQFVLIALIGYALARTRLREEPMRTVALVMVAAWIGEGIVLSVAGGLVANELGPFNGWYFWLVATAGPLQPLVAVLGAWPGSGADLSG
jgi:hypothetical protein